MFIGQYYQKVDDKNRIVLPSKFRNKLTEITYITLGHDNCLSIYTDDEFNKLQEKLLNLSDDKKDYRMHVRAISSSATECNYDSHGRVTIPANLLKTRNIDKDIVIVGNLDHIEIWALNIWEEYYKKSIESFDELSEKF